MKKEINRSQRVKRLKKMILWTIALAILIPVIGCILLSVRVFQLKKQVAVLTEQLSTEEMQEEASGVYETTKVEESVRDTETKAEEPAKINPVKSSGKKVYLTFDCIPGDNTGAILDALAKCGVKATFFVTADTSGKYDDIYKRIVQDGHTIAMASYSNSYSKIYESTEAFTDDLTQISDYITNLTGIAPDVYRFPGGSMNQISNVDMVELVKILNSKHITYFDWNVNSGDTADNCSVDDIVNNVTSGIAKYDNSVVLLHDDSNRSTTAEAIEPLVESIKAQGAEILPIDNNTYKVQYIKSDTVG